jgi:hypothetical protein
MAVSLSHMVAAPREVEVQGKTWTFSPLTAADIGIVIQWFKDMPLVEAQTELTSYQALFEPKEKRRKIKRAKAEYEKRKNVLAGYESDAATIAEVERQSNIAYSSPEGVSLMAWLSLRKIHTDVSKVQAADIVSIAGVLEVQSIMDALTYPDMHPDEDLVLSDEEKKTQDGSAS